MQTQIITNEFERTQLWGALNVGDMAAPEYLKELKGMISDIRTIANELNQMTLYLEFSQMTFVRFFMELIEKVNVKLSGYNADLKQGRRMEMCCLLSKRITDKRQFNWIHLVEDKTMMPWIGTKGFPFTIVVDKQGIVRYAVHGTSEQKRAEILDAIKASIAE